MKTKLYQNWSFDSLHWKKGKLTGRIALFVHLIALFIAFPARVNAQAPCGANAVANSDFAAAFASTNWVSSGTGWVRNTAGGTYARGQNTTGTGTLSQNLQNVFVKPGGTIEIKFKFRTDNISTGALSDARFIVAFKGTDYLQIDNHEGNIAPHATATTLVAGTTVNITTLTAGQWYDVTLTIPSGITGPSLTNGYLIFKHQAINTSEDENFVDDVYVEKACPVAGSCETPASQRCNGIIDYSNYGMASTDIPASLEYDNFVSNFHSSVARDPDGGYKIWGDNMSPTGGTQLNATVLNGDFYSSVLTGKTVLKVAMGSFAEGGNQNQAALLTTDGLYAVGSEHKLISEYLTTGTGIQKITGIVNANSFGLPFLSGQYDIQPTDVRMMFGTYESLVLTTCAGNVFVLPIEHLGMAGRGQFTTMSGDVAGRKTWHQVTTMTGGAGNVPLSNIIHTRGAHGVLIALDGNGDLWTWGQSILIPSPATTAYATGAAAARAVNIGKPAAGTIKMIGATYDGGPTYYVLYTDGRLFAAGRNNWKQLGNYNAHSGSTENTGTTSNSYNWIQPKYSAAAGTEMNNIHWISPNEHSSNSAGAIAAANINVLTKDSLLYNWGREKNWMLGRANTENTGYDPGVPNFANHTGTIPQSSASGPFNNYDKVVTVETGGHTTMILKTCQEKFGFAGHWINGSFGNEAVPPGNSAAYFVPYTFQTTDIKICGVNLKQTLALEEHMHGAVCEGTPFKVVTIPGGGVFSVPSGNATYDLTTKLFTITGPGDITISYDNVATCSQDILTETFKQYDWGNLDPGLYPQASASTAATNRAWLGAAPPTTDCETKIADEADGFTITTLGITGSGTQVAPWILTGNQNYTFQVTVNGNGTAKPVYWAVWYDVNGDGNFTDTEDIFQTGTTNHGSPAYAPFSATIPVGGSAAGATNGAIRVIATATNTAFTKAMNGTVQVLNGEVEDYYVQYSSALGYIISGTIFNDNNAQTGGAGGTTFDGNATAIFANLYDGAGNFVASTQVLADGTYTFTGVPAGTGYKVQLSEDAATTGDTYTANAPLPGNFENVSSNGEGAGHTDGVITFDVTASNVTGLDFGINEPPTAIATSPPSQANPGGTTSVDVTSGFSGTDPNSGTIESLTITTFPTGATSITVGPTTYYPNAGAIPSGCAACAAFPGAGIPITTSDAGVPDQAISVDPILDGLTDVLIPFTVTDNAGLVSGPATLTVPFTAPVYTISGKVYTDPNGTTNGADGTVFDGTATPIFANLYNSSGAFVASVPVATDGTYTFTGIPAGTGYQVQLSEDAATTGDTYAANADLPGTFENVSSNGETTGHTDGVITFDVTASNVTGLDFGIQQPPVANTITNPPSDNSDFSTTQPGGFDEVTGYLSIPYTSLDPLGGTDPEDGGITIAGNTVKIGVVNDNTKLYYDFPVGGVREVLDGEEITNFDPNKLVFYGEIGSGDGSNPFGFTYQLRDAAGVFSPPATYEFSTSSPLPVTLASFTARKGEVNSAVLNWTTTEETNSEKFEVEHSANGKNWNVVGMVDAKGKSKEINRYSYTHITPTTGENLYRLKMIDRAADRNGVSFAYSRIVSLSFNLDLHVSLYPNPATDLIKVKIDGVSNWNDVQNVKIYNLDGKSVYTSSKVINGEVSVSQIPTGAYVLTVTLKNGSVHNAKIIIVK